MLELLIAFLISCGFIADKAEYQALPEEIKIEYQEIFEATQIGSEDFIMA